MTPAIATKLAQLKAKKSVYNWIRANPKLCTRVRGRVHINDGAFFDALTDGRGLLTWPQARDYAASIVGMDYLIAHLDLMDEIESAAPEGAFSNSEFEGYFENPSIPWQHVLSTCRNHLAASKAGELT